MRLKDKYIAVTGGTAGIGLAIARGLQGAGAKVLVIGRNKPRLEGLRANGLQTLAADISRKAERERVLAHLQAGPQPLDGFINNAGMMKTITLASVKAQELMQREIELNLHAPIAFCLALLPALLKRPEAALVNVTTGLVYAPKTSTPGYSASKNGLHAFTQSLRHQMVGTSVRVLDVLPPLVDTDMVKDVKGPKAKPRDVADALIKGLQGNATEIRVGQAKMIYLMSRLAPGFASKIINNGETAPKSQE